MVKGNYQKSRKGTKKTTLKRVKAAPQTKEDLVKLIKKTFYKQSETKNKPYSHGKVELYHNSGSPASGRILHLPVELDSSPQMPLQGTTDITRIGDKINLRGIKVRMLIGQKNDRPNVTFRIVVIRTSPNEYPNNVSQMFDNVSGNILLDTLNTDRFKVVYSKYIKNRIPASSQINVDGGAAWVGKEQTFAHRFYLKSARNLSFSADGGNLYSGDRHFLFVFAYDAYGTLETDNIGYFQTYSNLFFKDP